MRLIYQLLQRFELRLAFFVVPNPLESVLNEMKWLATLLLGAFGVTGVLALDGYSVPTGSPGYQRGNSTQAIQFDSHSLFVNDKRVFIMSGELHHWRLPVPELWSDVLQKMKVCTVVFLDFCPLAKLKCVI